MRVLIAEDETIIRLDLKGMLEAAGLEVCAEARDGEEAVRLALETEPDVVLLDVKMPRLDGIEAARRILDERPLPIVMVTAYGEQELVSRAVEAGVFGYLVKPFREGDLLPAVETARARHAELVALREEADSLAEALAARKAIERAKGILSEREGLSEQEAFERLRKASQISGRPLKVVAEALIATFEREPRRLDPVEPWHLHVEEDDVRLRLPSQAHRLLTVSRLRADLEPGRFEHPLQIEPDDRLVLGDQDTHGYPSRSGSRSLRRVSHVMTSTAMRPARTAGSPATSVRVSSSPVR